MLTISGCGGRLCQYFRKSSVVQIFPEGFKMVKKATFRLADEAMFNVNAVSDFEVVGPLSFGLLVVLFRPQTQKILFRKDLRFSP